MFSNEMGFVDRYHAGEQLASALIEKLQGEKPENLVVLGLVRGGLPVAEPVANALNAPLDVFISRKIGAPYQPEFGIGAIAEGGHTIMNEYAVRMVGATEEQLEVIRQREAQELQRRRTVYRKGRECQPVKGKTVVVVDDGLATGVTARAALTALRAQEASRLILAVPVGSSSSVSEFIADQVADDVVCLLTPTHFRAVGQWYEDFRQTTDDEVIEILQKFAKRNAATQAATTTVSKTVHCSAPAGADTAHTRDQAASPVSPKASSGAAGISCLQSRTTAAAEAAGASRGMTPVADEEVVIRSLNHNADLHGTLHVPADACGLVVFAHGSGSSRNSPRNRQVAAVLNSTGIATLLMDLLSVFEAEHRKNVFDIPLLASRLQLAVEWLEVSGKMPVNFPVGFFGASTGGGAALWAAAYLGQRVSAVVVRGGRPDLAAEKLPAVTAPSLLLVGGDDRYVLELNQSALELLGSGGSSQLVVVPHAGHLFEGPGQLEEVAERSAEWFVQHMRKG